MKEDNKIKNKQQIKKLQKILDLKESESIILLASRLKGWLIKNQINEINIIKALNIILSDLKIKEREELEKKEEKKINFGNIKHTAILKFYDEILDLKNKGLGARKIQKILKENHKAKVSYVTIYNFINLQKKD